MAFRCAGSAEEDAERETVIMLDLIAAIFAGGLATTLAAVLIGLPPLQPATRLACFAAAATWLGVVVAAAALGALRPGALGPMPAPLLPFGALVALLFGGWLLAPRFRSALLSVPLPALVGLNAGRLGGVLFLLLYAEGRLSAPFAPVAAVGDMLAGALAALLAAAVALGLRGGRAWLGAWNVFGALDLVVAIVLGAVSMPGTPFRVFVEGSGTLAMTAPPWVLVPGLLVPVYLLIHLAIAEHLRTAEHTGRLATA